MKNFLLMIGKSAIKAIALELVDELDKKVQGGTLTYPAVRQKLIDVINEKLG